LIPFVCRLAAWLFPDIIHPFQLAQKRTRTPVLRIPGVGRSHLSRMLLFQSAIILVVSFVKCSDRSFESDFLTAFESVAKSLQPPDRCDGVRHNQVLAESARVTTAAPSMMASLMISRPVPER